MKVLGMPASGDQPSTSSLIDPFRPRAACLHILLTEDSIVNQKVAVGLFSLRGHSVVVANNGHEALAALEKETFDVVLMDVQMPEMDGFDATIAIRRKEQTTGEHVPIIAMTAHAMKGDRERCLEAGMDAYVSKPIEAAELYRAIETYVPRTIPVLPPRMQDSQAIIDDVLDWALALDQVQNQSELLLRLAPCSWMRAQNYWPRPGSRLPPAMPPVCGGRPTRSEVRQPFSQPNLPSRQPTLWRFWGSKEP